MEFNKAALSLSDALPGDKKLAMNRLLKVRPCLYGGSPSMWENSLWRGMAWSEHILHTTTGSSRNAASERRIPGRVQNCRGVLSPLCYALSQQLRIHTCRALHGMPVLRQACCRTMWR